MRPCGVAVDGVDGNFLEVDPPPLQGGFLGGDGHDQGDQAVLPRAGDGAVLRQALDELFRFLFIGLMGAVGGGV